MWNCDCSCRFVIFLEEVGPVGDVEYQKEKKAYEQEQQVDFSIGFDFSLFQPGGFRRVVVLIFGSGSEKRANFEFEQEARVFQQCQEHQKNADDHP